MDLFNILSRLSVINRDNGKRFTITERLDAITSLLWESKYRRINSDGLFNLYAAAPLKENAENVIIVSSHVDCERNITKCFSQTENNGTLRGTYDNSITNAAVLYAMLSGRLPENVYVCFTGDEEYNSSGASDLSDFLAQHKIKPKAVVVLDVTDAGWEEEADFTVENNFWGEELGAAVISFAEKTESKWKFVPEDLEDIPEYVERSRVVLQEAEADETWEYDERDMPCFSLCLPVYGEMHSNEGVLVRQSSFIRYAGVLVDLLNSIV